MRKTNYLLIVALAVIGLSFVWIEAGPFTALGIALTIFALVFVFFMRSAADEILRFEREQRPDLYR